MVFTSWFRELGLFEFPEFSGIRVQMMPFVFGDEKSLPSSVVGCYGSLIVPFCPESEKGRVGYVTIDEKIVEKGRTHRRPGLHVDGVYGTGVGAWGGGGAWGARGAMIASSVVGCRAWVGTAYGYPDGEGCCEHLKDQFAEDEMTLFASNTLYQIGAMCVHESLPMKEKTKRQFLRISFPSEAPWFEGYTVNPTGVLPVGPILPRRRRQMEYADVQ